MYFRRYFEGEIAGYNTTKSVSINGTSSKQNIYISQTQVMNEAIKETLLAAGVDCEYDNINCILYIEGVPVQILSASNAGNMAIYRKGNSSALTTVGTSYGIGTAEYKFYVSLLGDPKGILVILLGYYSNPAALNCGIAISQLTDLRDGTKKVGIAVTNNPSSIYVYNELGESLSEISTLNFSGLIDNIGLTKNGSIIPLVESIDTTGFFKIDQCYMGHRALNSCSFYNIGGDIFMQFSTQYLIKCTTKI